MKVAAFTELIGPEGVNLIERLFNSADVRFLAGTYFPEPGGLLCFQSYIQRGLGPLTAVQLNPAGLTDSNQHRHAASETQLVFQRYLVPPVGRRHHRDRSQTNIHQEMIQREFRGIVRSRRNGNS